MHVFDPSGISKYDISKLIVIAGNCMDNPERAATSRKGPLPTIELQILLQLAKGPGHGYQMMKCIAADTGGAFSPGPGTLYVALRRLTERRLIEPAEVSGGGTRRQRYRLTSKGRTSLDRELEMLDDVLRQARRAGWSRSSGRTPS